MTNISMFPVDEPTVYPHPNIDLSVKLLVERACIIAWNQLVDNQRKYGVDLDTYDEDHISEKLQQVLDKLMGGSRLKGFDYGEFQTVAREENLRNFNGSSIDKQPDLIFRLCGIEAGVDKIYNGIFVECKIIDECKPIDKSRAVGRYCGDGIIRFVKGDYAWAMLCGMMIGYVRNSCIINEDLTSALKKPNYSKSCGIDTVDNLPQKCMESKTNPPAYTTEHRRDWAYPNSGAKPGNIVIRHLWLRVKST